MKVKKNARAAEFRLYKRAKFLDRPSSQSTRILKIRLYNTRVSASFEGSTEQHGARQADGQGRVGVDAGRSLPVRNGRGQAGPRVATEEGACRRTRILRRAAWWACAVCARRENEAQGLCARELVLVDLLDAWREEGHCQGQEAPPGPLVLVVVRGVRGQRRVGCAAAAGAHEAGWSLRAPEGGVLATEGSSAGGRGQEAVG